MSEKQDRQGVRTASQLEQKYQFGKKFSEILGIANDARDKVDSVTSELRNEITENYTSIVRDTEKIIMSALENYSKTEDTEELRQTLLSELTMMAEKISMDFTSVTERITNTDGQVQTVAEDLQKHFDFTVNGLTIRAGESQIKLRIDNNVIAFYKGEIDESDLSKNRFGWWDGVDFHTGNIVVNVNERAQLGGFAFVPRTNGSLSFLKVGG